VLLIDGLENFDDAEQKTAIDLVREASDVPGFSVVVTARTNFGVDEPSWLPPEVVGRFGRAPPPIYLGELTDSEVDELVGVAPALSGLLAAGHPARDVARNLYRLNRLLSRNASEPLPHTEIDMMEQWWKTADGSNDASHRERARVLLELAEQALDRKQPLDIRSQPADAVDALVRSETLRDLGGDRVAFHHDVLREWAIASVLSSSAGAVNKLPLAYPAPVALARALELCARFALERSSDISRWRSLLDSVSAPSVHGSWRRVVLLALVRSEAASTLLMRVGPALFADDAVLLRELIRTVMAMDVLPAADKWLKAGIDVDAIPKELKVPTGAAWPRLIVWLLASHEALPAAVVPDVAEFFADWCTGTLGSDILTPMLLHCIYGWLREFEAETPGRTRFAELKAHQVRPLVTTLRLTLVLFARRVPALASEYLKSQMTRRPEDPIVTGILKSSGTLAQAAPKELAELTVHALIRKRDGEARRARDFDRPFTHVDYLFVPASPAQGPFYALLTHAPEQGLALVRQIVDHAIAYFSNGRAHGTDAILVNFESGIRAFPWYQSYFWSRDSGGNSCLTCALMALEAKAHERLDRGESFESVLHDVLGFDAEVPAAYLLVAVDLILSHWPRSREAAVPFLASPQLLSWDLNRVVHDRVAIPDLFGVGAMLREPASPVSIGALRKRPSRRATLDALLSAYSTPDFSELRTSLRARLQAAAAELGPPDPNADLSDPAFMVLHGLNLIDPANWRERSVTEPDGTAATELEYVPPEAETRHLKPLQEAAATRQTDAGFEAALGVALDDPKRSSPKFAESGLQWAQEKQREPQLADDAERRMREQAILAGAVISARDGTQELRAAHVQWIRSTLSTALESKPDVGAALRGGLRFNDLAMAFAGWVYMLKDGAIDLHEVRVLLQIAARGNPAGAHGFARTASTLVQLDPRFPRAILRAALAACVRPAARWDLKEDQAASELRYSEKLAAAVEAESAWLSGGRSEPAWPYFPLENSRRRRGMRIGATRSVPESRPREPTEWVNYQAAAIWIRAASVVLPGKGGDWLSDVLTTYWEWTFNANGAGWSRDAEVERAPTEWNDVYFENLALHSGRPGLLDRATESICALPDTSFFDTLPIYLRALDTVYFATRQLPVAEMVKVREAFARRMMASTRWQRLKGTLSDSIESHIGPPIAVLFYNDFLAFGGQPPKCYLTSTGIDGVDAMMPTLAELASSSPCLFVALSMLSLLEVSPRRAHVAFSIDVSHAWLQAYPSETNFWVDHGIGRRLCNVIDQATRADRSIVNSDAQRRSRLDVLLVALVRLGIAEASILETAISQEL
jgi:hypothetical protein